MYNLLFILVTALALVSSSLLGGSSFLPLATNRVSSSAGGILQNIPGARDPDECKQEIKYESN